ncbi:uncharacterized protein CPUR_07092 [Claviceps purpurea 20.1]|uniref:F-box domain-containing protein n=1 Tax=Claviceps purpurea (strain 20.1) TaxID=1111077 RepID=M1WEY0_CLAP2|nr:uncharacterized protein CPUR_07092 [Claviceps purpurea 20.1]
MPPSRASKKPELTMADLIESGRHSYAAKRYRQASRFFSKALDFQATTFEALGELRDAMEYAEWMVEFAPQLPDGYLRMGRIARLQWKYHFAWKIYAAGVEAHKETAAGSSAKLQKLYDAHKLFHRFSLKQDPFCLPAELVAHIFSYLDLKEIIGCFRVCKQWERTLTSPLHGQLWRNMIFEDLLFVKWMPDLDLLRKMLLWAGDGGARKIVIPTYVKITQPALTLLLKASPRLEHLDIHMLRGELTLPSHEKIWDRLRNVSITGCFRDTPADLLGGFPHTFLQNAASTLEHLTLLSIPQAWCNSAPSIPLLPKLKSLRMRDWKDQETLFPIVCAPFL